MTSSVEIVGAVAGSSVLGAVIGAIAARPKVRADAERSNAAAAAQLVQTATDAATDLLGPLVARIEALEAEAAANRQTILAQQATISEQGRTIALQNTSLAETRSRQIVLERGFAALQEWVKANGGDPNQILASAGHPPSPGAIPTI